MEKRKFGEVLKEHRHKKGLSCEKLGKACGGISKTTISHYEVGTTSPSLLHAIRLADYLGFSLDHLSAGKFDTTAAKKKENPFTLIRGVN